MPIYEFRCHHCWHEFEELVPIGKSAPCPCCGHTPMQKMSGFVAPRLGPRSEPMGYTHDSAPGITLNGCTATNNGGGGVHIGKGARVASFGGTYRDNGGPDVDNHGTFESTNDRIGRD